MKVLPDSRGVRDSAHPESEMKRALARLYSAAPGDKNANMLPSASDTKAPRSTWPIRTPMEKSDKSRSLALNEVVLNCGVQPTPRSCGVQPTPRTKASRAAWFTRHTSDAAIAAAIDGSEFDDAGVSLRVHECTNLDPETGLPCHVGLYHADPGVAKAILKANRIAFLEPTRGSKSRGNEIFKALALPADGVGLNAAPENIRIKIDMLACDRSSEHTPGGHLGILVRRAPVPTPVSAGTESGVPSPDGGIGALQTVIGSVYGRAKLQTQLKPGDIIVGVEGVAEPVLADSPWVRPCQ